MSIVEQNIILFYADYLSLKNSNTTVTDNCKYYFIWKTPINSGYICDTEPFYDKQNKYYIQACTEYQLIKNKFGEDGVNSFIEEIAYINNRGIADAIDILNCIHQYSPLKERRRALYKYNKWKNNQLYTHLVPNEDGELHREQCSRYVAYAERYTDKSPELVIDEAAVERFKLLESDKEIDKKRYLKMLYDED